MSLSSPSSFGPANGKPVLVVATNNQHKLAEIKAIIGHSFDVKGLADIGCHDDIPETADTLAGNAEIKARYVRDKYGLECIADDTGLIVDGLGGEPGVRSARYAGPGHDSKANMELLLDRMVGLHDRSARFVTVVALTLADGGIKFSRARSKATSVLRHTDRPDSVMTLCLCPREAPGLTFAEMSTESKNAISHRGRAIRALADYLLR